MGSNVFVATATAFAQVVGAGLAVSLWSVAIAGADPTSPAPIPKATIEQDGTYAVGNDVQPGTYRSAGPVGSGTCYWKRIGGPSGGDIVDNALSKKPQVVHIEASDKAFKTDGCQPWQSTDVVPGQLPADASGADAGAQLHSTMDTLNGLLGQFGGMQSPQS